MHAGQCQTFEAIVGICGLNCGLCQGLHSDVIGSRQDSVRDLAWIRKQAIIKASQCVRIVAFRAPSEREMKEAVFQSHVRHIHWVQHIE